MSTDTVREFFSCAMTTIVIRYLLVVAMFTFAGCATMKPSAFEAARPVFDPTQFFSGRTMSSGVIENRGGMPLHRVVTKTLGHWQGDALNVEQDITLDEEQPQHRSWVIRKLDAHHYAATANDIVGIARGEAYGNVFHWNFTLALSPGNPLKNVQMSQWMYLQSDGRAMVNHSVIRKFGVVVTQVTEEFRHE